MTTCVCLQKYYDVVYTLENSYFHSRIQRFYILTELNGKKGECCIRRFCRMNVSKCSYAFNSFQLVCYIITMGLETYFFEKKKIIESPPLLPLVIFDLHQKTTFNENLY